MSGAPHPLCCQVFSCNRWASFGYGATKDDPGLWVCADERHRAWAQEVVQVRSARQAVVACDGAAAPKTGVPSSSSPAPVAARSTASSSFAPGQGPTAPDLFAVAGVG